MLDEQEVAQWKLRGGSVQFLGGKRELRQSRRGPRALSLPTFAPPAVWTRTPTTAHCRPPPLRAPSLASLTGWLALWGFWGSLVEASAGGASTQRGNRRGLRRRIDGVRGARAAPGNVVHGDGDGYVFGVHLVYIVFWSWISSCSIRGQGSRHGWEAVGRGNHEVGDRIDREEDGSGVDLGGGGGELGMRAAGPALRLVDGRW